MTHVLTLIAPHLEALPDIATLLGAPQWQWLDEGVAADLFMEHKPKPELLAEFTSAGIDHIFQPREGRIKKLLISDMDSTMIQQECIDELADCVGLKDHVSAITERAMNGELDFASALRARVALLENLPETALEEVFDARITMMPGARTLVQTMAAHGAKTLLVSGGFRYFTSRVATRLGFDADEANDLEIENGRLTGRVIEPILDKESKRAALFHHVETHGLNIHETLAIGDGANDLPMLQAAGLGLAYHAKPIVQAAASNAINFGDLTYALYAQGIPKSQWQTF